MTPAHDPNDFEVGLRHNLETIRVLDDDGTVNENGGKYNGMDRYECRKAIVKPIWRSRAYLDEDRALLPQRRHLLPLPQRRGAHHLRPVVRQDGAPGQGGHPRGEGRATIKFVPERFTKTYINWMENVHDWCISRQLWWGHQIPAWYCDDCGHMTVPRTDPTDCEKCGSHAHPPGPRRAGHLVLLRPVALLHPGLARTRPRTWTISTPPTCWSRAMTSSSSGWPA